MWVLGAAQGFSALPLIAEPSLQPVLSIFVYDGGLLGPVISETKVKFFQTTGLMLFYNILHK